MLVSCWWKNKQRPKPLTNNFPYIALLTDSTTYCSVQSNRNLFSISTNKPMGSFDEGKKWWDGKNKMYGLKKEVSVMASKPHYALFSQSARAAGTHDYEIHKEVYDGYVSYLQKSTAEKVQIPSDRNNSWANLLDKGYVGPDSDTPGERRITPKKGRILEFAERQRNEELNRIRVPIEQFFGRFYQLWGLFQRPYKYDYINFDLDSDNCILLTNEHIMRSVLVEADEKFNQQRLEDIKAKYEEVRSKRKAVVLECRRRKKARMQSQD
jgi:hypothetical protein